MPAVARSDTRPRSGGPRWHPSLTGEPLSELIERAEVLPFVEDEDQESRESASGILMETPLAETSCPVCGVTSSNSTLSKSNSGQSGPSKHRCWSHGRVVSGVAQIPVAPRISSTRRPRG